MLTKEELKDEELDNVNGGIGVTSTIRRITFWQWFKNLFVKTSNNESIHQQVDSVNLNQDNSIINDLNKNDVL